jgi:hypothetical protein
VPEQVGMSSHRETGPSDSSDGQPLVRKFIIPPVINLHVPGCTAEVDINCNNTVDLCSPTINTVAITARDSSTIISDATFSTVITGSTLVSRASTSHISHSRGTPSVSREIRSRLTGVPTPKQPLVTPTRVSMIRKQLRRSGFSESPCNKIAWRKRPSTLSIYQIRWAAFVKWCKVKKLDPVKTPTHIIADFLVDLFDKTCSVGSIRGYRSAISTTVFVPLSAQGA